MRGRGNPSTRVITVSTSPVVPDGPAPGGSLMDMYRIRAGDAVVVTDASGGLHNAQAQTGRVRGRDFPVVWVVFADGEPTPWPASDVKLASEP